MLTVRKTTSFVSYAGTVVEVLYSAGLIIFAGLIAYNHFRIISAPTPIEAYEGTTLYITGLIAHGHNPYAFAFQPEATDVYPPLYNMVIAPLTLVFGDTLQLHRLVCGICIVLSSGLLAVAARRSGARWIDCASAAVIAYGALIYYSTAIAGISALGELLFLASVLVPWLWDWSGRSLVVSVVCGILAFYTKQYFLLSLGIVSVYLFLATSKTWALIYASAAAGALAASLVVVHLTSPYFLADTVFAMRTVAAVFSLFSHATQQLLVFCEVYAGLILIAAAWAGAMLWSAFRTGQSPWPSLRLDILSLQAPLLQAPISYPWLGFAISTAAILLSLGQNEGNYMSYLFQLMTPFLLLGVCTAPLLRGRWRALALLLYLVTLWNVYDFLPKDFNVQGWKRARTVMCASQDPLATPMLLWSVLECRKPVHNGGGSGYFLLATPPDFLEPRDPSRRPAQIWRRYMNDLTRGVCDRRFDVLALVSGTGPGDVDSTIVQRYYQETEQFPLSFGERQGGGRFLVHIWRPKPDSEIERADRARGQCSAYQPA